MYWIAIMSEYTRVDHLDMVWSDIQRQKSSLGQLQGAMTDMTDMAVTRWLPYEKEIVSELYERDGLLLMGRGLGVQRLLAYFIRLYSSPKTLVLCLNANEQIAMFHQLVLALGLDRKYLPKVVDAKSSIQERLQMYKQGGCFFVTSRILVVDLLNNKMDSKMITGLLVNDAHRVSETSIEAFIVRLYREVNRQGFIKAFSDDPVSLSSGFNKMEQVLKHLYLRDVHLYPRFHVGIHQCLEKHQPAVYEIEVGFSPRMKIMQEAILVALEATMKELQRSTKALDASDLTMERALSKSFANTIRRQLDPVWHKLQPKARQLVGDLTTLRQLLSYLPRYDAISYYSFLVNHQTMNGAQRYPSAWLFTEAADRLVTAAKERLYQLVDKKTKAPLKGKRLTLPGESGNANASKHAEMLQTLEGNPKWEALMQTLDEINLGFDNEQQTGDRGDGARVLIMVRDERTCAQLRELLALGEPEMLRRRMGHYLLQREAAIRKKGGARTSLSLEQQLIMDAAAEFRATETASFAQNTATVHSSKKTNGRKRPVERSGGNGTASGDSSSFGMSLEELEAVTIAEDTRARNKRQFLGESEDGTLSKASKTSILSIEAVDRSDQVILCTYDQAKQHCHGASALLQDIQPSSVILYDPDMSFIRELEVFHAMQPPAASLEIYFMLYEESAEQQSYLSEIHKEKRAFESLIHQKAHLMMPANVYDVPYHVKAQQLQQNPVYSMDTRTGGRARSLVPAGVKVVVDVREFRSALPSMLHKEAMLVQPVTLEIGDYILSPQICVERKSISDLFGSLNSGRLFNQAENMGRFYELPVLLIEFSQGKAFSLQDPSEIGSEISASNIVSKLTLLILHFPNLRLLWSRSPHATVDLFKAIKKKQPEPDLEVAAAIGTRNSTEQTKKDGDDAENEEAGGGTGGTSSYYNTGAMDVLRKLPGINDHNYRKVLGRVQTLAELSRLSKDDLYSLLGKVNGQKLYSFFHTGL